MTPATAPGMQWPTEGRWRRRSRRNDTLYTITATPDVPCGFRCDCPGYIYHEHIKIVGCAHIKELKRELEAMPATAAPVGIPIGERRVEL